MRDKLMRHIRAQDSAAELLETALKNPSIRAKVREVFQPDYNTPEDMEATLRRIH